MEIRFFRPGCRGYHAIYHGGDVNHCPGCGRSQWLIGRITAECVFCSTALPLETPIASKEKASIRHGSSLRPIEMVA